MDRVLLESNPHAVAEGMAIAATRLAPATASFTLEMSIL